MSTTKKTIFIVEDDPFQQKMLKIHFEESLGNYKVQTFANPDDLLKHIEEKPYAVVLDHYFNGIQKTGLDYLTELRKTHRRTPVIYHTTLDDENIRKQVLALGAEAYILKDSASLVRLRTALDLLEEKIKKKGFFGKLFGG